MDIHESRTSLAKFALELDGTSVKATLTARIFFSQSTSLLKLQIYAVTKVNFEGKTTLQGCIMR